MKARASVPIVTLALAALAMGSVVAGGGTAPAAAVGPPLVYFSADDGEHGQELWSTDGTDGGTRLVADINPGSSGSQYFTPQREPGARYYREPVMFDGKLLFGASDGVHGFELWRTAGTEGTTQMVVDLHPGKRHSWPAWLTPYRGAVYFMAGDGRHGRELWRTDGTAAGTRMVKDINPEGASGPRELIVLDGVLYFTAKDGQHRRELWRSDGTAGGTEMVKDINPNGGSDAQRLTVFDGRLYFAARTGPKGLDLWRSNGTATGTHPVMDVVDPQKALIPRELTPMGGYLYFEGRTYPEGQEPATHLWRTDGTSDGTRVVAPGLPSNGRWLTPLSGQLILTGGSDDGQVVWTSDGTADGTVPVSDPVRAQLLTRSGPYVYFTEYGPGGLWRTDGTPAGTQLIGRYYPQAMADIGGVLYFCGYDDVHKSELWVSDGTTEGTHMLVEISPTGWSGPTNFVPTG